MVALERGILYNEKDGLYYRYEFGDKQVDGATGKQLAVKNIILQNCASSLKDSKNGTLDINYQSGGTGKYITNGKAIDITWSRASASAKTQYFDENGKAVYKAAGSKFPYLVRINISDLNIREKPTANSKSHGFTGKGVFTIVEEQDGWGLLKSYAKKKNGWIKLSYAEKL